MKKPRIGWLPFYISLYDEVDPSFRERPLAFMRELIGRVEEMGIDVIPAPWVCRTKEEFDGAVRLLMEQEPDAVVTQHLAYSPSLEAIDALLEITAPLIVFDTTPDREIFSVSDFT